MAQDFSLVNVPVASTPLARLEEFLQSRGKRMTQQRRQIVELVFSQHEHFDAEALFERLQRQLGRREVSRPTVYRTLNELVEADLLVKMDIGGRAVYEHDYGYPEHDHLHCSGCNRLIEFASDELNRICEEVARQHQFRVSGHQLIVTGLCQDCRQARVPQRRQLDRI